MVQRTGVWGWLRLAHLGARVAAERCQVLPLVLHGPCPLPWVLPHTFLVHWHARRRASLQPAQTWPTLAAFCLYCILLAALCWLIPCCCPLPAARLYR